MPSHPASNEGFRLLEEFLCKAIPDPSLPPCEKVVPLATQAEVEGVRVLEASVSDTIERDEADAAREYLMRLYLLGRDFGDLDDDEERVVFDAFRAGQLSSLAGEESALARLEAAINNLSDVDRQIVRLFRFERLTSREIAERMALPLAVVHRSLQSAVRAIRDELLTHRQGPPDVTPD
jgi:hypothetical protein